MTVILSYGMGVDSTALILNWIYNPDSRRYKYQPQPDAPFKEAGPFDLKDLVVITAMTGDEFPDIKALLEKHILPLFRKHGIRYVQVARKTFSEKLAVLDDSRSPKKVFLEGAYTLSDELLGAATVPTYIANHRLCSIHAKGWPLDTWIKREMGGQPFVQALGFNAQEEFRIKRDVSYSFERWKGGQKTAIYPLLWDWNWSRKACEDYITSVTGAKWVKSACAYCPFAAGEEPVLVRFRKYPEWASYSLFIEYCALALNERMSLYPSKKGEFRTLRGLVEDAGDRIALKGLEDMLNRSKWAIYRVQRLVMKPFTPRRVTIMEEGSRKAMQEQRLPRYGTVTMEGGVPRVITLPREENVVPTMEEIYTAAPRVMESKVMKHYDFQKNWDTALSGNWDRVKRVTQEKMDDPLLDPTFIMGAAGAFKPEDDPFNWEDDDREDAKWYLKTFAGVIASPYDPYEYADYPAPPLPETIETSVSMGAAGQAAVWHTDIVVARQGFNVKITPENGGFAITLTPDTPSPEAERAMEKFARAMGYADDFNDVTMAKITVEHAIGTTKAQWNGWHREAYGP